MNSPVKRRIVKPNTVRERFRQFCRDNAGECLSIDDIQTKYGVSKRSAHKMVAALRSEGFFGPSAVYLVVKPAANDGSDYDLEVA